MPSFTQKLGILQKTDKKAVIHLDKKGQTLLIELGQKLYTNALFDPVDASEFFLIFVFELSSPTLSGNDCQLFTTPQ